MFTRFASIFQQAVDAFVPDWPLLQEFVAHWKAVTKFFVDKKDYKISIEQTSLPGHISRLLDILIEEETEQDGSEGAIGSCMEYLLQHRILETLYTLARTDCPPGMKQVVLQSFTRLLSRIKQPTLPHISVHRPVLRLVRMCGEVRAGPSENDEVLFLCTLCSKIKTDPYLVNFFIESPKSNAKLESAENTKNQRAPRFTIIDSLLNLLRSEDARVSVKACEGLMLITSLPDDNCARHIIENTAFVEQITGQLCALYSCLPKVMDPGDIEMVDAKWGLDMVNLTEDRLNFVGKRQLVSFLSWMDFCDQLIACAQQNIASALAENIQRRFLTDCLEPAILQTAESVAITATALLCRCVQLASSDHLVSAFVFFILGDDTSPESQTKPSTHRLRKRFIERCDHISDELCITTWKLFEMLLCKPHLHVLHNLILRNLLSFEFIDPQFIDFETKTLSAFRGDVRQLSSVSQDTGLSKAVDSMSDSGQSDLCEEASDTTHQNSNNNSATDSLFAKDCPDDLKQLDESSEECQYTANNSEECHYTTNNSEECQYTTTNDVPETLENQIEQHYSCEDSGSGDNVNVEEASDNGISNVDLSPAEACDEVSIQQIVYMWLNLMPEEAKTSCQSGETGYDTYLRDAEQQCRIVSSWYDGIPRLPSAEVQHSTANTESLPFYEGSFLNVLLNKLSRILHQSYEVNLQVTNVLSRLTMLPHAALHEFLLNPCVQLKPGVRIPYSVLLKVSNEVHSQLSMTSDLPMRLLSMRRQLIGSAGNLRSSSDVTLLAGVIVLEEFCKELAATAFVKYYNSQTAFC